VPDDERELLARELAQLAGPKAGTWAAKVDSASRPFVTRGTGLGARIGARFTKVDHARVELELAVRPNQAARRAADVLAELGTPREAEPLAAVVPSGFGNMNPALVTVTVVAVGAGSRVTVEAAALEGLVRQRAAAKAAARVAESLQQG
jgi:hypothetical protein